jgi:hypothetical protein
MEKKSLICPLRRPLIQQTQVSPAQSFFIVIVINLVRFSLKAEPTEILKEIERNSPEQQAHTVTSEENQDGYTGIGQVQPTRDSGNRDETEEVDPLHYKNDPEAEDYDDDLDGDFDAEGETDYGSQYALDPAEIHDNPDTDASAPVGNVYTEYEDAQEGRDEHDELHSEDVTASNVGVVVQGSLNHHHGQELTAEAKDGPHVSTDIASLEAPAVVTSNGEREPDC